MEYYYYNNLFVANATLKCTFPTLLGILSS